MASSLDVALAEMAELLPLATKTTGRRPLTQDLIDAREALALLALEVTDAHGISRRDLSLRLGLHDDAVGHLLRSRGFAVDPDSVNVKGVKRARCQRGHDLTSEESRTPSGKCRECWKIRKERERVKKLGPAVAGREDGVSIQLARLIAPRKASDMTSEEIYMAALEAIASGAHTPAKLAASALDAARG